MAPPLLPIFVKLSGRQCLVVGAGSVGAAKIAALLEAGARVTVVAPEANLEVRELAAAGKLRWRPRPFRPLDLDGQFLVIAATPAREVNHAVFAEAQTRGILCNAVDDPPNCDFYFSAVVRRGDLQVAVSTAGESPAVAQMLRNEIEAALDESVGDWLSAVGDARREIMATHPPSDERKRALHLLAHTELCTDEHCSERNRIGAGHPHLHAAGSDA